MKEATRVLEERVDKLNDSVFSLGGWWRGEGIVVFGGRI